MKEVRLRGEGVDTVGGGAPLRGSVAGQVVATEGGGEASQRGGGESRWS